MTTWVVLSAPPAPPEPETLFPILLASCLKYNSTLIIDDIDIAGSRVMINIIFNKQFISRFLVCKLHFYHQKLEHISCNFPNTTNHSSTTIPIDTFYFSTQNLRAT